MTVVPIPAHQLKGRTWYYGITCECKRMHALCEDLFAGKTDDPYLYCFAPIAVACLCGRVAQAKRLCRFKTS